MGQSNNNQVAIAQALNQEQIRAMQMQQAEAIAMNVASQLYTSAATKCIAELTQRLHGADNNNKAFIDGAVDDAGKYLRGVAAHCKFAASIFLESFGKIRVTLPCEKQQVGGSQEGGES